MRIEERHAGTEHMQYQARAVNHANIDSATSVEIERRRRKAKQKQRERQEARIERQVIIYRRRAGIYSVGQMAAMITCCVAFLAAAIFFVHIEANMKQADQQVTALRQEYEALHKNNDILEAEIVAGIDINEIYRVATEELGMNYPQKSQIIVYQKTESEHVRQYEEIP
ncbi:MAG: cell division protein FtsL [Lachnospiraceae bacterium]|nr:cell division protein FtsL [Lachnospiraceae bacterium]